MPTKQNPLLWQIPLTLLACVLASLAGVWAVSELMGFAMRASAVAVLSVITGAAVLARDLRTAKHHPAP